MFKKILCLVAAFVAVNGYHGDLVVLHCPDSVQFKGNEEVRQSLLPEIFSACLGYTPKQRGEWSGMSINNPLRLPEAVVGIAVEGVNSIPSSSGKRFPLNVDEVEETTWQALSGRVEERDSMNTLVRINLGDGVDALGQSALGELKPTPFDESSLKSLSPKRKEDHKFLEEMQLLNAISKKVRSTVTSDDKPDVYWFVLSALPALLDYHGDDSAAATEAFSLLNDSLTRISNAFIDLYNGRALVAVFTNNVTHVRHTRAATSEGAGRVDNVMAQSNTKSLESTTEAKLSQNSTEYNERQPRVLESSEINISKAYDENYPVMFNIFLWFGVAFVFSLIAICITIANMDPGRDSIIYRMTSNRMKKDN